MNFADFTDIRSWYNPRRKRFWVIALIVLYSLAGFLLTPWLIKRELPELTQSFLARSSSIAEVRFNPWLLRLEAVDFTLLDDEGEALAGFDRLIVDLEIRSLFLMALVLREASVIGPTMHVTRYKFADNNIGRMLNDMESMAADPAATPSEQGGGLRMVIDELNIVNGVIELNDQMQVVPFNTRLEPINITVSNLNTLPEKSGTQQIDITTETGAHLSWTGSLQLSPLISTGHIELEGSPLPLLYRYLQDQLAFQFSDCCMEIGLDYRLSATPDGSIEASIDQLAVSSRNLAITTLDNGAAILELPELRISGGNLRWPQSTLQIDELLLDQPTLNLWLNAEGNLNLAALTKTDAEGVAQEPGATEPSSSTTDDDATIEWSLSLDRLVIKDAQLSFADRSLAETGRVAIPTANITVQNIRNLPGNRSPFEIILQVESAGTININGTAVVLPEPDIEAELTANLPVNIIQPWLQEQMYTAVDSGTLQMSGSFHSHPEELLDVQADIEIVELQISETFSGKNLVGWQSLNLDDAHLQLSSELLEISEIYLKQPTGTFTIAQDGTTNFSALSKAGPIEVDAAEAGAENADENDFTVRIGKTTIDAGALLFTDLSIPLPFSAPITDFSGTLSAVASNSTQPSVIAMEGKVGKYGLVSLGGNISVMAPTEQSNIQLNFSNIDMPDLTPYTAQFVGREIASGKMALELDYVLAERKMRGENSIVLSQFKLGEKVPNPDAMSLPLDLAVGLLRDANGTIDLNLKVSGDLDDPKFSTSGIIMKALANVITKAAASPFKLLGNLVPGGDSEELNAILFRAGDTKLTPPELEKLHKLGDALALRPNLVLVIPGGYNSATDLPALKKIAVEQQVATIVGEQQDATLTKKTRHALEQLTQTAFPDVSLRTLRKEFQRIEPDTGNTYFDELAYMAELRTRLEMAQTIETTQLLALAEARRAAISAELITGSSVKTNQLKLTDAAESGLHDNGWVEIDLELSVSDIESNTQQPVATEGA